MRRKRKWIIYEKTWNLLLQKLESKLKNLSDENNDTGLDYLVMYATIVW